MRDDEEGSSKKVVAVTQSVPPETKARPMLLEILQVKFNNPNVNSTTSVLFLFTVVDYLRSLRNQRAFFGLANIITARVLI